MTERKPKETRRAGKQTRDDDQGPGKARSERNRPERRSTGPLTTEQQALAAENIGLVGVHLRNRVPTPRQPMRQREYEDLFQEGCVALLRAARRYNPETDGPFGAYALPRIRGAVHAGLHELFSMIRVPPKRYKDQGQPGGAHPAPVVPTRTEHMPDQPVETPVTKNVGERIRHMVWSRFECAVDSALQELRRRSWRRRNPCAIMTRIAYERLLIPNESERTALRQIARDSSVSSGRASAYEQVLTETVQAHLEHDAQLATLLEFAREDDQGLDGEMDAERHALLRAADMDSFDQRFAAMDRTERAEALYAMLEKMPGAMREIALNLYTLTRSREPIAATA